MILPPHIKNIANLSDEAEQEISTFLLRTKFQKGTFLFEQGNICKHIYYIEKGMARVYYNSENGKEITAWFSAEHTFITAIDSFYHHKPTRDYCELLEDSVIYSLKYTDMENLLEKSQGMAKFAFHALYEITKKIVEFNDTLKFQTAQERYKTLLTNQPNIFQRVQLSYIASYLGITPETLSRLRAEK